MSDEFDNDGKTIGVPEIQRFTPARLEKSQSPGSPPSVTGKKSAHGSDTADPHTIGNPNGIEDLDLPAKIEKPASPKVNSNGFRGVSASASGIDQAEPGPVNPWPQDKESIPPPNDPPAPEIRNPVRPDNSAQAAPPPSDRKPPGQNDTQASGAWETNPEDELDFASIRMEFRPLGKKVWQRLATFSRQSSGPWVIGRSIFGNNASLINSITEAHFHLLIEQGGQFVIEPLESLNGVYEKLIPQTWYPLVDQCRLIIGDYVIEFRTAEPAAEPATLCSDEGEQFRSTFLSAPARLLVLGPDGEPSVGLPLLARRSTIVGRGGPNLKVSCDITLPDEKLKLSRAHCEFVQDDDKFFLVDLGSFNGTFLQLDGRTQVNVGDVSAPDQAAQFFIGKFLFRFIDERGL